MLPYSKEAFEGPLPHGIQWTLHWHCCITVLAVMKDWAVKLQVEEHEEKQGDESGSSNRGLGLRRSEGRNRVLGTGAIKSSQVELCVPARAKAQMKGL